LLSRQNLTTSLCDCFTKQADGEPSAAVIGVTNKDGKLVSCLTPHDVCGVGTDAQLAATLLTTTVQQYKKSIALNFPTPQIAAASPIAKRAHLDAIAAAAR
jgi:hypothetical protein